MTLGLPGNPHEEYTILHHSTADAILALAYEQRTANLIALATYSAEVGRRERGEPLIEEVSRRLGMEGD